jgi:hypothetical protein
MKFMGEPAQNRLWFDFQPRMDILRWVHTVHLIPVAKLTVASLKAPTDYVEMIAFLP